MTKEKQPDLSSSIIILDRAEQKVATVPDAPASMMIWKDAQMAQV